MGGGNRRSTITPSDDSDEDNNTSPPPRDTGKENESVLEGDVNVEMLKLPTQWSEIVRHPSLSVSADGRELNFNGGFPLFLFPFFRPFFILYFLFTFKFV